MWTDHAQVMFIVSGDSWTARYDFKPWHDYFPYKKKLNLAWGGAGNYYIADSLRRHLIKNHSIITKVIIFWSEFQRYDIIVDKPFGMKSARRIDDMVSGSYTHAENGYWQFSGSIDDGSEKWKKLFRPIFKTQGWENIIQGSLSKIRDTLYLLDHYNIDYNFGFVYEDDMIQEFGKHPRFIPIIFRKFCLENNLIGKDGHHGSAEGHLKFADKIKEYVL